MSRVKQKRVLFSTSKVAVPVSVIEMIFGRRKVKILILEIYVLNIVTSFSQHAQQNKPKQ